MSTALEQEQIPHRRRTIFKVRVFIEYIFFITIAKIMAVILRNIKPDESSLLRLRVFKRDEHSKCQIETKTIIRLRFGCLDATKNDSYSFIALGF